MQQITTLSPLLLAALVTMVAGPAAAPPGQITVAAPAQPAQPSRDVAGQQPPAVGTASISGAVTVAGSGLPARKVRVTLSGEAIRGGRGATTDEQGRFSFSDLPAGRYTLSASKPGYVNVSYGQRKPGAGRPGTPIQLADNQRLGVQLQIPRGGVITGTVLDEIGEAIPGTQVRVMRYTMQSGQRTLQQGGTGTTDDRGLYRIYGLQPGEYIVAATPRNTGNPAAMAEQARAELERARAEMAAAAAAAERPVETRMMERVEALQGRLSGAQEEAVSGYAPIYYPGTTSPASAAAVTVNVSEERAGVDFQLQLVAIARVEGVVVTSDGRAAQNIQVSLINVGADFPGIGDATARPDRDGRFRIANVAPGQYTLLARGTLGRERTEAAVMEQKMRAAGRGAAPAGAEAPDAVRLWAMTDVAVDGRDVSNLVLTLQPGMTVSGRVAFEGSSPPPAEISRLRVSVTPAEPGAAARQLASAVQGRVDASGKFTITGVAPGRYRLTGSGAGQTWTTQSAMVSGQDALDVPFEVKANQSVSNAVLTFTDRQTEVTGTLVDGKGQPAPDYTIIIYPAEREFWTAQSRRIRSARPATDGSFTVRNLPPGEYRISAVLDPDPGTWYDPQFLQQLETSSMRVPLAPGEKKVQNLRVGGN